MTYNWVLIDNKTLKELTRIKLTTTNVSVKDHLLDFLNANGILIFRIF